MKFSLFLLLLIVGLTMGCTKPVRFEPQNPYASPYRTAEPLTIVLPDDLNQEKVRVNAGGGLIPTRFNVFYGQALREESKARFRGMFDGGVSVVSRTEYEQIALGIEPEEDPDKKTKDEKPKDKKPKKNQVPKQPVGSFVADGRGYLLEFREIQFGFDQLRPVYAASVAFTDRSTSEVLVNGPLYARGRESRPAETDDVLAERLRQATLTSVSVLMLEVRRAMFDAIEEREQRMAQTSGR